MIYDGHLHMEPGFANGKDEFLRRLASNGISGGLLISIAPKTYRGYGESVGLYSNEERIKILLDWVDCDYEFFPFYWIDPLEEDAEKQVNMAVESGVKGFKIICNSFYPGNEKAMRIYEIITEAGKPILFHSGILYDGDVTAKFCRPVEFEALLGICGIRFSLAHVSWPWCDECIALYGKFHTAYKRRKDRSGEMFIDLTPGAPAVFRKDMMTKLFGFGCISAKDNVYFGTDCTANNYNQEYGHGIIERDVKLLEDLNFNEKDKGKILTENLRRFVG